MFATDVLKQLFQSVHLFIGLGFNTDKNATLAEARLVDPGAIFRNTGAHECANHSTSDSSRTRTC